MGNQIILESNDSSFTSNRKGRATLKNLEGTWFVDDKKVVIESGHAMVYHRSENGEWCYHESVEVKDEFLHFQVKDHILSKGRLRADSNELMFRNGEDVRIWMREDPFSKDVNIKDGHEEVSWGGDLLSLRHPSDMGANSSTSSLALDGPADSFEGRSPSPNPSEEEEEYLGEVLPEIDFVTLSNERAAVENIKDSLLLASQLSDSNLSMSDMSSSSDLLHEPSWVDEDFFTEI